MGGGVTTRGPCIGPANGPGPRGTVDPVSGRLGIIEPPKAGPGKTGEAGLMTPEANEGGIGPGAGIIPGTTDPNPGLPPNEALNPVLTGGGIAEKPGLPTPPIAPTAPIVEATIPAPGIKPDPTPCITPDPTPGTIIDPNPPPPGVTSRAT